MCILFVLKTLIIGIFAGNSAGNRFLTTIKKGPRLLQTLLNMAGTTRLELATFGVTGLGLAYFHHLSGTFRTFGAVFGAI
jgi:hypothetical protein